ncbi:prepilin-type N-terminal cleavage/methylation domain-containing protein [Candidatus Sumerlaeota bacterium]|nr:prepilin-type N-terminal cleavage/methylation domain-containing protein [Candidatus Sumerlaeota bacterium]
MRLSDPRCPRAFTLIELLIVVAIIAILAAIALPNFLEAQARAKVSRARADMRTIATAVELYRVDWNRYFVARAADLTLEYRYRQLTTPTAYITSPPLDPFGDRVTESNTAQPLEYRLYDLLSDVDAPTGWTFFDRHDGFGVRQVVNSSVRWFTTSQGPDHVLNLDVNLPQDYWIAYDPTNGTVSQGDIFRYGPG